jgi:hypothetical protein
MFNINVTGNLVLARSLKCDSVSWAKFFPHLYLLVCYVMQNIVLPHYLSSVYWL